MRHFSLAALFAVLAAAGLHAQRPDVPAQPLRSQTPEPPRFHFMGPASGGRIASVAGVPGDTNTYYAGAASGGVWKSTDGAKTFTPVSDAIGVAAIGALAVAPSDPAIVWAGTGEAWAIRDSDVMGDGIYKSTDAGATWSHMGLDETARIGRIIVHPTDPAVVYACALGRTTGPQQERGVFKTADGGKTWTRSLFVDANTGCSGLTMDAANSNVLYAGTWQVEMHTWAELSGGPGSAVYKTTDGGATWKKLEAGLPKSPVGKIDVAVAPNNSQRVYALIQTPSQGSLWRSDDAGASWKTVSYDRRLIGRAGYYIRVAVNPKNADEVLVANSSFLRSTDGGSTYQQDRGCGDCHDIWMDSKNGDHWIETGDGGMGITTDHGRSFTQISLPIAQNYHVAVDNRVPYWIYSNRQDNSTMRGRSDSVERPENGPGNAPAITGPAPQPGGGRGGRGGPGAAEGAAGGRGFGRGAAAYVPWEHNIGGCESGFTLPDISDPDIVWASCYGNEVTRYDARTKRARSVSPWMHTLDSEPNKLKYRCHWTPPLATDPFDHNTVYYGCQVIFATLDGGQSWKPISPDLSTKDPSRIVSSGGIVPDNLGQFYGEVVFAIAPSTIKKGLIWAGTNDGKIWYTPDAGANWVDVTANVRGLPSWGTITKIEPSSFDPGTAYVAVDFHLVDNRDPYIYRTSDFGKTWTKISDGLPKGHPLSYVKAVAENPNKKGMLFAGTGHAFFYSMDDGAHWTPLQTGLPPAPATWIVVEKRTHDLVVSTYGRGLFVMPDITVLEQTGQTVPRSTTEFYPATAAFRMAREGRANFTYTLASEPAAPATLEIVDSNNRTIRRMDVMSHAGLNRVAWDLRYEPPHFVQLRTLPPDNPHIWEDTRFRGKDTRPILHWGIESAQYAAPIAAPGKYTARLTVGGQTMTQPFEVLKDPAIPSPDADLAASTVMQVRVRDDQTQAADMVNRFEEMRKKIEDQLGAVTGARKLQPADERTLRDLDKRLLDVELRLISKSDMQSDDKYYMEQYKVYMNLIWFGGTVGLGAGDVAGGAEYRPTNAASEILAGIEADLAAAKSAFDAIIEKDMPVFNKLTAGVH
jgi:photosystem II stability/assembly factor-like uncharacterized protein